MTFLFFLYHIFRFGFALIFVGLHCALMTGLFLEWRRDQRIGKGHSGLLLKKEASESQTVGTGNTVFPKVSVIIPVHNEMFYLQALLQSLALQDYPGIEFIFVDDRSSDKSPEMLRDFAETFSQHPCFNRSEAPGQVQIITLQENPGINRKQYALERGIERASGELLLFTDADCEVPNTWIRSMVARMADERIGITIGPVFKKPESNGFFHLYQCFDHAIRYMYLAASTGLGAAGGGFGNNLILRKDALQAIGGYNTVQVSPTEDAALISRIRSCSHYQIRSAMGKDVFVMTHGESSWSALINQTLRWNNGGLFSPDPATRFNFGFLMITISMGIIVIPLLVFFPSLWLLTGAVMLAMTLNTIATLGLFGSALPKKGAAYIIQLVFTPMYFTFLTILGFCGVKTQWKGSEIKHEA